MVLNKSQNCIFSCDNRHCVNNSPETFKNIICPFHLSQVFGLKIKFHIFEAESRCTYFGPFLILDDKLSFDENTIVFPTRDFIDQHLAATPTSKDFFNYKLNPRIYAYLNNLLTHRGKLSESESRYQLEIIRNLFFVKPGQTSSGSKEATATTTNVEENINLFQQTEASNQSLLVNVSKRIYEMNKIIGTEDYATVFEQIKIMSVSNDDMIGIDTFTPFMKFILLNCLTDEHKLPQQKDGIGITTYANLFYKDGYGFVTTTKICNPTYLCVFGTTTGTNNFYQLKTRVFNNRTVQNISVHMKDLPDNLRPSNILNTERNFCWNRPR